MSGETPSSSSAKDANALAIMSSAHTVEGMDRAEDANARVMMKLSTNAKRGLGGVVACALAQVNDGSAHREWAQTYFRFLMEQCLDLPLHMIEGLLPIVAMERARSSRDRATMLADDAAEDHASLNLSPRTLRETPMNSRPFVALVEADITCDELIAVLHYMLWKTTNAVGYDARARSMFRFLVHEIYELPWTVIASEESALGMALFLEANELKSRKVESPPLASAGGVTAATVLFGTAGAGLAGYKTDRRTSGIKQFEFELLTAGSGMNVYICVSGWLENNSEADFKRPWGTPREYLYAFYKQYNPEKVSSIDAMLLRFRGREDELFASLRRQYGLAPDEDPVGVRLENVVEGKDAPTPDQLCAWQWKHRMAHGDQFCLKWEKDVLLRYGTCIRNFTTKMVLGYARGEIVKYTVFAALFAAAALPTMVVNACSYIDSEWTMAMSRADMCGKLLATALLQREQGLRPVSLIGYGMGARLIFACLKHLAAEEGVGLIENAVLLGCPIPVVEADWASARKVVAGRLVNGYSENDWMLAVMYRYQGWALDSAGISPIEVHGVENVNLSHVIGGHLEYPTKIGLILDLLHLED
ncbi:hypothetical protein SPRG_21471 [Saprolegnia parasitica CBS 223.65]|uniref:DUF726 domain-containing protein n=1 Tax=Saprolegnia parasitica (strain CBS 223.65) TaxID=695850 RepID=A0A067BMZ7_SAPPC|nr:hypothetical protein SPRG_21471 [Saprolegnia parasitica CBS 223.65]KDO19864.1 hypothetical protein SPRG_21471 [Saprolegnia parasitica CBS 223.65]|eukprot:XP_012209440.1 hypothetical protein SPRG_21471 [Saprolegnia parasitica CBS 223.65]